ncbi:MAG: hypothetical protein NXH70_02190 [Hyphomonas sp.]|nr:hypothetical protein [Hyphomonas sp.]
MKFIAGAIALAISAAIFANVAMWDSKKDAAVRTIKDQHNIEVTKIGFAWFGCAKDDEFSFKWEGVNADGKTVKGNACAGIFKGTTIRFK